jgi:hypothetical protein
MIAYSFRKYKINSEISLDKVAVAWFVVATALDEFPRNES